MVKRSRSRRRRRRRTHNKTRRRNRRNQRKNHNQTGGKYYGKGTYGVVFGDPPAPFIDKRIKIRGEPFEDSMDSKWNKYVTKVARTGKVLELDEEAGTLKQLKRKGYITESDEVIFRRHMVFPEMNDSKLIDMDEMDDLQDTYGSDWYEGYTTDDTPPRKLESLPLQVNDKSYGILIEKGKGDLNNYIKKLKYDKSDPMGSSTISFLDKYQNIIDAVDLCISKKLTHYDLKLQNAIETIDGIFKLIDITDLGPTDFNNERSVPDLAFLYYIRPVPHSLLYVFVKSINILNDLTTLTPNELDDHIINKFRLQTTDTTTKRIFGHLSSYLNPEVHNYDDMTRDIDSHIHDLFINIIHLIKSSKPQPTLYKRTDIPDTLKEELNVTRETLKSIHRDILRSNCVGDIHKYLTKSLTEKHPNHQIREAIFMKMYVNDVQPMILGLGDTSDTQFTDETINTLAWNLQKTHDTYAMGVDLIKYAEHFIIEILKNGVYEDAHPQKPEFLRTIQLIIRVINYATTLMRLTPSQTDEEIRDVLHSYRERVLGDTPQASSSSSSFTSSSSASSSAAAAPAEMEESKSAE